MALDLTAVSPPRNVLPLTLAETFAQWTPSNPARGNAGEDRERQFNVSSKDRP
jgi:hypothetical protein